MKAKLKELYEICRGGAMPKGAAAVACVEDMRLLARKRLPKMIFDFIMICWLIRILHLDFSKNKLTKKKKEKFTSNNSLSGLLFCRVCDLIDGVQNMVDTMDVRFS